MYLYLLIQLWGGLDGSVGRIWPMGRRLMITAVDQVNKLLSVK